MNGSAASRLVRLSIALLALVTLGCVLAGNAAKPTPRRISLPTDWSHAHLIFSQGRNAERMQRLQEDPRFLQQILRQIPRQSVAGDILPTALGAPGQQSMRRDWSEKLGLNGGAGAGNFPAKFSFDSTTADCTNDYVVFSTGLLSSVSQADVVAFNNLYSGCGGAVPSVLWAYSTSPVTQVRVLTSPALSLDGSQIAFTQTSGPQAQLVLLKWAPNSALSVTAPQVLTPVVAGAYRTCTAPCMTKFDLGTDDRTSSVFIDYSGDIAWVGDSKGILHKITGVFTGTPTESGSPWPLNVTGGQALTSPVFDHVTGRVFVGAKNGFLYRIDGNSAALIRSGQLDRATGIVAGPVVDSGNGRVYVAASNDGSGACLKGASVVDCSALFQLTTSFATANRGAKAVVGISTLHPASPNPMYNGYFDSSYLNSVNGTGNIYVCGNTGAAPTLYQVPVTPGAFGAPVAVAALAPPLSTPGCSPVTDISNPNSSNGTAERAFVSVQNSGQVCTNPTGCLMSFVTTPWQASTSYNVGQQILVRAIGNPDVLFVQVAVAPGTSGATMPAWGFAPDIVTTDNTVGWLNQGRIDDVPFASWTPNTTFSIIGQRILASNGRLQLVDEVGTSGATEPTWTTAGLNNQTADGPTLVWRDAGPPPAVAIAAASGTSGIIIDNTFDVGILAGTSQIYFTTLGNQTCTTSGGTGGCAVQASQPTLQ